MESIKVQFLFKKKKHTKKRYPSPDFFLIYLWFLAQPTSGQVPLKAGLLRIYEKTAVAIKKIHFRRGSQVPSGEIQSETGIACNPYFRHLPCFVLNYSFVTMCRNKV